MDRLIPQIKEKLGRFGHINVRDTAPDFIKTVNPKPGITLRLLDGFEVPELSKGATNGGLLLYQRSSEDGLDGQYYLGLVIDTGENPPMVDQFFIQLEAVQLIMAVFNEIQTPGTINDALRFLASED